MRPHKKVVKMVSPALHGKKLSILQGLSIRIEKELSAMLFIIHSLGHL